MRSEVEAKRAEIEGVDAELEKLASRIEDERRRQNTAARLVAERELLDLRAEREQLVAALPEAMRNDVAREKRHEKLRREGEAQCPEAHGDREPRLPFLGDRRRRQAAGRLVTDGKTSHGDARMTRVAKTARSKNL